MVTQLERSAPSRSDSTAPGPVPSATTPGRAPSAPSTASATAASRARALLQRHSERRISWLLAGADGVALALAVALAIILRQSLFPAAGDLTGYVADAALPMAAGWLLAIILFNGYDVRLIPSGPDLYRNLLHASLAAAGIVGAVVYLADIPLSRTFFTLLFLIGPVLLLGVRVLARRILNRLRARGHLGTQVLAVGSLEHIDQIARTLHRERWLGYSVIGALTPTGQDRSSRTGIPVLGAREDLLEVVRRERPGVLLFAAGAGTGPEEFRRTAWQLEREDVRVIVVPALSEIAADRVQMRPVAGLPLVHMDLPRAREALRWTKRAFDIIAAGAGLLLLAPLMGLIALRIRLHDGGPVIFRQDRVGRDGQHFEFLKFRSMVTDAEAVRVEKLERAVQDRGNAVMFKMREDPRITKPGRFLRKYSLDELPQLWNVLRGDMSLVGPRPALPQEVAEYDEMAWRRLSVRPGITGLWQVSGRSDLSWEDTVRLDLYYVDNWSFLRDLQILLRTVRAVLAAAGAY
ncbi:sugar transferase [Brachybacterium sp. UMB0905]|uniref:sugar transferase n=1 Tax=Brachybacterium sp. UMB0905 TaxID=2069310 RepID=UPI000C7FF1C3|nr:sugar transferase [Brachybacterium sp. UMB0905]PMC74795.1 sugar transferase [Brachybacterium sp. UMB0905]